MDAKLAMNELVELLENTNDSKTEVRCEQITALLEYIWLLEKKLGHI